jgi:hypothetical protein
MAMHLCPMVSQGLGTHMVVTRLTVMLSDFHLIALNPNTLTMKCREPLSQPTELTLSRISELQEISSSVGSLLLQLSMLIHTTPLFMTLGTGL